MSVNTAVDPGDNGGANLTPIDSIRPHFPKIERNERTGDLCPAVGQNKLKINKYIIVIVSNH